MTSQPPGSFRMLSAALLFVFCAVQALRATYYMLGVDIVIYKWRRGRRGGGHPPTTGNEL